MAVIKKHQNKGSGEKKLSSQFMQQRMYLMNVAILKSKQCSLATTKFNGKKNSRVLEKGVNQIDSPLLGLKCCTHTVQHVHHIMIILYNPYPYPCPCPY